MNSLTLLPLGMMTETSNSTENTIVIIIVQTIEVQVQTRIHIEESRETAFHSFHLNQYYFSQKIYNSDKI